MKCFVKLPDNSAPGFTSYYLSTELTDDPTHVRSDPPYKFHLNLSDASYVKHRDAIVKFIDQHGLDHGISSFKYFNVSHETRFKDVEYQEAMACKAVLNQLRLSLEHDPSSAKYKQYIDKALELANGIKDEETRTNFINAINARDFDRDSILNLLEEQNLFIESVHRYIGQSQFTIYLLEPIQQETIINFCKLLLDDLKKLDLAPGKLPNTDITIIDKFNLITFRQDKLNDQPATYVSAANLDPFVLARNIAQLKSEASESPLYKALVTALTPKPTDQKTPSSTASSNSMTTFGGAAAAAAAATAAAPDSSTSTHQGKDNTRPNTTHLKPS